MEKIIIISLLIIIILLLLDKKLLIPHAQKKNTNKWLDVPSVMGETRKLERQLMPSVSDQRQEASTIIDPDIFESETKEEVFENIASKKELEDILVKNNDWDDEEEDWHYQVDSKIESGFATGVTFQELSTAGQLLQQDVLEPDLEQQAVLIIQKIQGTELFDLLENSLGEASTRVAALLSQSISNEDEEISFKRKDDADGFDIGEFI